MTFIFSFYFVSFLTTIFLPICVILWLFSEKKEGTFKHIVLFGIIVVFLLMPIFTVKVPLAIQTDGFIIKSNKTEFTSKGDFHLGNYNTLLFENSMYRNNKTLTYGGGTQVQTIIYQLELEKTAISAGKLYNLLEVAKDYTTISETYRGNGANYGITYVNTEAIMRDYAQIILPKKLDRYDKIYGIDSKEELNEFLAKEKEYLQGKYAINFSYEL